MTSPLDDALLDPPGGVETEIGVQMDFLATAGATLTGAERLTVAEAARAGVRAGPDALEEAEPLVRAARRFAAGAWTVDQSFIDGLLVDGLTILQVVEVLGVVARLTAVDTAVRGLGAPPVALPAPRAGVPDGAIDDDAKIRSARLPTVGPANPITVLNALPAESAHQESLSNVLYMSYVQMGDLDIDRDLHRTQIELVAARTSSVNECVY